MAKPKFYFDTFRGLRNHVYAESYDLSHRLLAEFLSNFDVQPYEDHMDHVVYITTVTKKKDKKKGSNNEIETMLETESTPETERPDEKQKSTQHQIDKTAIQKKKKAPNKDNSSLPKRSRKIAATEQTVEEKLKQPKTTLPHSGIRRTPGVTQRAVLCLCRLLIQLSRRKRHLHPCLLQNKVLI